MNLGNAIAVKLCVVFKFELIVWFIREVNISVSDRVNEKHGGRVDYVVAGDDPAP